MLKFQTIYDDTPDIPGYRPCTPDKTVVTVPDMSFSVQEILERYTSGVGMLIGKSPIYDNDPDFENVNPMLNSDDPLTTQESIQLEHQFYENAKKVAASKAAKAYKENLVVPEP